MTDSWAHFVRPLTEQERQREHAAGRTCRLPCKKPLTHLTKYRYIKGQPGRVSWARRLVCTDHAETFAARFSVPFVRPAGEEAEAGRG